jgi:hypothetical protein
MSEEAPETQPEAPEIDPTPPASLIANAWLVTCKQCGAYDLVGKGHPATRPRPNGTVELFDRSAIRHDHADDCEPNEDGNYPLDFSFTTVPPVVIGTAGDDA